MENQNLQTSVIEKETKLGNTALYVGSGVAVTTGMLIIKGVVTVVHKAVTFVLEVIA